MKILILLFICTFTINISAKEKKREISKIDYEIISESLIKKQIAFILYLGNHKINILDHNLIDMFTI